MTQERCHIRPGRRPSSPKRRRPAAPAAAGDINITDAMEETGLGTAFLRLPRADYRRLNVTTGVRVNPNGDRGAARRNNQLGNAGRVQRVIEVGPSKIYFMKCDHPSSPNILNKNKRIFK